MALSLAIALGCGLLAFLVARAATGALLLAQQQAFFAQVAQTLRGGIESLNVGDVRAARRAVERLDAEYTRISLMIGFAAAALAAVLAYLRLERRARND